MSLRRFAVALLLVSSLAACASQSAQQGASTSRGVDFARLNSTNLDCSTIKPHEWAWVTPRTGCVEYERRP